MGNDSSFTSHAKFVHEVRSQNRRTTAVVESSSENSIMKRHAWLSPCTYSRMLDTILQLKSFQKLDTKSFVHTTLYLLFIENNCVNACFCIA